MKKIHITLTETEFDQLKEMKTYFSNQLPKIPVGKDIKTLPVSYSWVIGSTIRECYKLYFNKKTE